MKSDRTMKFACEQRKYMQYAYPIFFAIPFHIAFFMSPVYRMPILWEFNKTPNKTCKTSKKKKIKSGTGVRNRNLKKLMY